MSNDVDVAKILNQAKAAIVHTSVLFRSPINVSYIDQLVTISQQFVSEISHQLRYISQSRGKGDEDHKNYKNDPQTEMRGLSREEQFPAKKTLRRGSDFCGCRATLHMTMDR